MLTTTTCCEVALAAIGVAALRLLAVIGLLAFPAFVGHGIVIPLVHVMEESGVPYPIALGTPLSIFVIVAFVAVRKLYCTLYGTLRPTD